LYNILIIINKVFHSKCSNTFVSHCTSKIGSPKEVSNKAQPGDAD